MRLPHTHREHSLFRLYSKLYRHYIERSLICQALFRDFSKNVERLKLLCKERKIPISRLEKDLGFGNGYISQLKKGTFPYDRAVKIAEYLGVTVEYLVDGVEKTANPAVDGLTEKEQRFLDLLRQMDDLDQETIERWMIATKESKRGLRCE